MIDLTFVNGPPKTNRTHTVAVSDSYWKKMQEGVFSKD